MARLIALAATLAGALLWAVLATLPPAPRGLDAHPGEFSATRAATDIAAISREPRPIGSAANDRARAYLAKRLETLGAEVSEQPAPLPPESLKRLSQWTGRTEKGVVGHNLIGLIPGTDRARPALMLMAHHDGVWGSPAAADDAMAIAAAIETARALQARGRLARDLILLFTDGEEVGLDGSIAFFDKHPLAQHAGMIVNMEARGAGGRANMFETGPGNGGQMRLYAQSVDRPATSSLAVLIYDNMPNDTDFTIAKKRGIAGYNIAVLGRPWTYHSPLATVQSVDPGSLQDMGDQVLALSSAIAFAAELPARTPNAAFADVLGRKTIVYPTPAGWGILLAATLLIGASLWRKRTAARTIGQGMILTTALLLHGALLLTAFNGISGSGSGNYYDRLAALPRLEAMAALLIGTLLMLLAWLRRPESRLVAIMTAMALMWAGLLAGGPLVMLVVIALAAMATSWFLPASTQDRGEGASVLLIVAATIAQATEPTAAPLFQWPLLLAAIAMAARTFLPAMAGLAISAIAAAIGLGHLLSQAHFIFLGIGAELPALMVALMFAGWPLLQPLWPDHIPRWLPGLALAAALVIALWVRLDPMAPSVPGYSLKSPTKTKD